MKMSRRIIVSMVVFIFAVAATISAQSIEGFWKSIDEEGKPTAFWEITERGGMIFGRIVKIVDMSDDEIADKVNESYPQHPQAGPLNTMRVLDVDWIYNMRPRRNSITEYTGGWIIDPESGSRYALDLAVLPPSHRDAVDGRETLEVKGKVLMFARSQYWVRSSPAEVRNF